MSDFRTVSVAVLLGLVLSARADLTIVQRIEGAAQNGDVTVKIKGDKERIDAPSQPTRIIDGKTGEMTDLLNDRKSFLKVSAEQIRAAAESMGQANTDKKGSTSKLTPTGKKDTVNGYETEEYVFETPIFKASFWVATNYPAGTEILKEMGAPFSGAAKAINMGLPDFTEFKGVPLKTVISVGPNESTTTVVSIKQEPLSASEFEIPKDFQELKKPTQSEPSSSATP